MGVGVGSDRATSVTMMVDSYFDKNHNYLLEVLRCI